MTGQARHIGSFANYCTEQFMFMIMQKYFRGFFFKQNKPGTYAPSLFYFEVIDSSVASCWTCVVAIKALDISTVL